MKYHLIYTLGATLELDGSQMRWLVSFTVLHSIVSHALALYSASPPSAVKLKNRTLQQPEALFRISKTARLNRETSDGWSPRAHLESSNNEGTRPYSSIRTQSHTFTAIRTTKAQTSSQRCVTLKARPLAIRPWTLALEPIAPQPNDRTRSTTSLTMSITILAKGNPKLQKMVQGITKRHRTEL